MENCSVWKNKTGSTLSSEEKREEERRRGRRKGGMEAMRPWVETTLFGRTT